MNFDLSSEATEWMACENLILTIDRDLPLRTRELSLSRTPGAPGSQEQPCWITSTSLLQPSCHLLPVLPEGSVAVAERDVDLAIECTR